MKDRNGYLFKRGHTYYVQWRVDGKSFVKSTGKTNLKDAEAERAIIMKPFKVKETRVILEGIAEQIAGLDAALDASKPPLMVKDAWTAYLAAKNRPQSGDRTLEGYESHFTRFSDWLRKKHPAAVELRDVTRAIADGYAEDMKAAKFRPSTYNQHIKLLDLVWSVLREPGRITLNPWAWDKKSRTGMARMKLNKAASRHAPLEPEQVEQLIALAGGDMQDLFTLLAFTGQRLFDCVHLRWESVKDGAKVLEIVQRKMERRGEGEPVLVPILPPVAAVLDNRRRSGAYVFPELVAVYSRDAGSTLSKRIGEVFDKAGLTRTRKTEGDARGIAAYGAHSFRHAFVSNARAYGIPDGLITQITGHKTEDMLNHYSHFTRKMASALAAKAGKVKSAIEAGPTHGLPAAGHVGRLRAIVKGINAKTWRAKKAELMEVLK